MSEYAKIDYDKIEDAMYFLSNCILEEKRTSKPLMLHCTRVGLKLLEDKQPVEVVVAGFLHDVLEDTKCTVQLLNSNFGSRVVELVRGCSFDSKREDILRTSNNTNYQEEWTKEFDKMDKLDNQILIIKAADINENSSLVTKIADTNQRANLVWKHQEFVRRFKSRLKDDSIFQELEARVSKY